MLHCFNLDFQKEVDNETLSYETGNIEEKLEELITVKTKNNEQLVVIEHEDIINNWFPNTGCHIFLSHSHKDKNLAIYIANKLYSQYRIKTFIDSQFWGFIDKAIEKINNTHCRSKNDQKYLDYEKSMKVASNFYLILSNALTNAIDESDSCWFLNTTNSLNASDKDEFGTYSPWIYTELNFTSKVRRYPHQKRPIITTKSASNRFGMDGLESIDSNLVVRYDVTTKHMFNVKQLELENILNNNIKNNTDYLLDNSGSVEFDNLDRIYSYII
ncbi:hypothetical protein [Photorhabdus cinerea]|uniref:TIR domain-containing protein n=1 Tax=Photorhabdus cinerea TaxID=471575 RepID=A0A7X5QIB7_9GAMM|nr:hypothetical protein [Photorhabdus cinerea]NHB94695.1 hypothetical protein [Photorhabdus cinerea]